MLDQGLAGVLGVTDDIELAVWGHPTGEEPQEISRQLGAFAVLSLWTTLLAAVEAEENGNRQSALAIPGQWDSKRQYYPVVPKGKEGLAIGRGSTAVCRLRGVEVHVCPEDVWATLVIQGVVHDRRDLRGQRR